MKKSLESLWDRIRHTELGVLLAIGVLALALLGFAHLTDEVFEGDMHGLDTKIITSLRDAHDLHKPIGPAWLMGAMLDLTSLGSNAILLLMVVSVLAYLLIEKKPAAALLVLAASGGGTIIANLLKAGFQRPRPDLVPHLVDVTNYSFPSGHAMMSTITYLTLGAMMASVHKNPRTKIFAIALGVLLSLVTGFSRVYLGVHWPTDVMAGWCVGAAWAMICWLAATWLQRRGKIESEGNKAGGD